MNEISRLELEYIKKELRSIISELDSISDGIRKDFTGIGNVQCANCIDRVANQYRAVKRKLDNLDTSAVTDSYTASHYTGGGRR